MLRAGRTAGVFQFESPLATDMLRAMSATGSTTWSRRNALMRPGPLDAGMHTVFIRRKRGEEQVVYPLPELRGDPRADLRRHHLPGAGDADRADVLAGISLAEADVLRKAVGKKDAELIKQELGKFVEQADGARATTAKHRGRLAAQIETFGRYGFNKSHSVAYSVLSYQTAWLKAHYPAEFMAALLSSEIGDTDKVVKYINEARELGLEVLPPDVNESGYKFTVVGDQRIRFGLGAVRNVGGARSSRSSPRGSEAPFTTLVDFVERVDLRLCNKRVLEALIAAGALRRAGRPPRSSSSRRSTRRWRRRSCCSRSARPARRRCSARPTVAPPRTSAAIALPDVPPWTEAERLTREKEVLGFFISGHPLEPSATRSSCSAPAPPPRWASGASTR